MTAEQAPGALPIPAFGKAGLSNCETEQIHLAGAIQPHGALLVASADTLEIVQAGGKANIAPGRLSGVSPPSLHRRIGPNFDSRDEVDLTERYHHDRYLTTYDSPLFGSRGLFRESA